MCVKKVVALSAVLVMGALSLPRGEAAGAANNPRQKEKPKPKKIRATKAKTIKV